MTELLFYMFAGILLLSAFFVVIAKNPVHSILFLILGFFNSAGLFLLLGAEFIAMLMVVVYVGAVAVLFLFVVMMLNINFEQIKRGYQHYLPLGVLVAVTLYLEIVFAFSSTGSGGEVFLVSDPIPSVEQVTNTKALGQVLYTKYALIFQASGLVLLVAMIGAIALTFRPSAGTRKQDINQQNARTREEAIEIKKVKTGAGI